jgi:hypothetical protein
MQVAIFINLINKIKIKHKYIEYNILNIFMFYLIVILLFGMF